MKKLNRFFSIILVTALFCSGCVKPAAESPESKPQSAAETMQTMQPETEESTKLIEETAESLYDWEDMAEITVVKSFMGPVPEGLPEVEAAINEITETVINTHVNYELIEVGSYIQQVSLKLSSGEDMDLVLSFPAGPITFNAMQNQGQLKDITALLDTYGRSTERVVGDYIKASTVNGKVYGVPVYRDYSGAIYACMRTDVLEDLGLLEAAKNMTCLNDLEKILAAVKDSDKWNYLSGMAPSAGDGSIAYVNHSILGIESNNHITYDPLAASDLIGVNITNDSSTVELIPETEGYKKLYEYICGWNEKGYIYQDSPTAVESGPELIGADKVFCILKNGELNIEASVEATTEMDMTCVPLLSLPITTSNCVKFAWCVPENAKNPEAAVAFLNLMYTDETISNLMAWGLEGRDYVVENGMARYPDDQGQLYHSGDFDIGNQFLCIPWIGSEEDIREKSLEATENAALSPYLGFVFDSEAVTNELAAISNAKAEFSRQINSGMVGSDEYDAYIQKLYDCGAQKVIDEVQVQLDEWIADNH